MASVHSSTNAVAPCTTLCTNESSAPSPARVRTAEPQPMHRESSLPTPIGSSANGGILPLLSSLPQNSRYLVVGGSLSVSHVLQLLIHIIVKRSSEVVSNLVMTLRCTTYIIICMHKYPCCSQLFTMPSSPLYIVHDYSKKQDKTD